MWGRVLSQKPKLGFGARTLHILIVSSPLYFLYIKWANLLLNLFQVSKLVDFLLETGSDDTKSLFSAISIYQMLLFYHGVLKDDFDTHTKNFQMVKKVLGSNLVGRKMDIRPLLIDRVQLQHELRVLESAFTLSVVTSTTKAILQDLIRLSTSHYSEVRSRAQAVLGQFYRQSPLAYQVVVDDLLRGLQQNATHEQLKGNLPIYTLIQKFYNYFLKCMMKMEP